MKQNTTPKKESQNPFSSLTSTKVAAQQEQAGVIQKRKAGRPRKPTYRQFGFRLDEGLHARFVAAAKRANLEKSPLMMMMMMEYLKKEETK